MLEGRKGAKFKFWKGSEDDTGGVGLLVAERWINNVIDVQRANERLLVVRVAVGGLVLNLICVYALQLGRSLEKEEFLVLVGKTISSVNVKERLVVAGDFNCHVGRMPWATKGSMVGMVLGSVTLKGRCCWS